jgi:pyruvate kinase
MQLRAHKTKITATVGPASASLAVMEKLIRAGMDVARLNLSHGTFDDHRRNIENLRAAARAAGRDVAILADLPGPKIRLGAIADEPIELEAGQPFTLTTEEVVGGPTRAFVSFPHLPRATKPGDHLFVNDGPVLEVEAVAGRDIRRRVRSAAIRRAGASTFRLISASPRSRTTIASVSSSRSATGSTS